MFSSLFKPAGKTLPGHPVFYSGIVSENSVIFGASGMGKTNAAHTATILIEKYSPLIILNFGIGGAFSSSGLNVGDIAVAQKEVYADEGVLLKDGLHTLELTGIPLLKIRGRRYFNEFPADKRMSRLALKASGRVGNCRTGIFLTVSACTGTQKKAEELIGKFSPVCENMEGAAIAHICRIYGIPFVEIRGISNMVEDRDKGKWDVKLAAENCQKAVFHFLKAVKPTSIK